MPKSVCSALLLAAVLPACSVLGGGSSPEADTGRRRALEYGISALDAGDFAAAAERLAPVAAICPVDELGTRALLLLAASELDGRNPDGRPGAAAELAAFHLSRSEPRAWSGALATELYVIALDLGADAIAADDVPDAAVIWERYLEGDETTETPLGVDADVAPPAADQARNAEADAAAAQVPAEAERGPRCRVPGARADLALPELGRTPIADQTSVVTVEVEGGAEPAPLTDDVRALQAEVRRLRAELASSEQELDRIRRTLRP